LISAPLTSTFQQTAGYDEFAAGSPPTVGTRPIKPSEQKVKRRSFSHIKAKSVGLQDFRQLVHTEPDARPRTAPGTKPTAPDVLYPSEFKTEDFASPFETPGRSKSTQGPPRVPDLPMGLAEMGGSKYFDLLQAAVSTSMVRAPPESTRTSFDFYNESIANRNSLYGKVAKLPACTDIPKASVTHRNNDPPTQTSDIQRASFDTMRASRNSRTSAREAVDASMPRSSTTELNTSLLQPLPGKATRQDLPRSGSSRHFVTPPTPSESRRLKRNGGKQADPPPQLSSILPGKSNSPGPPATSSSASTGNKFLPVFNRPKTVPAAPSLGNVSDGGQIESPTILTLKPFEDGVYHKASAEDALISSTPHGPSAAHKSTARQGSPSGSQPLRSVSEEAPPRMSSDRSTRKRVQRKPHSPDLVVTSSRTASEKPASVKSAIRKKVNPSRAVMDLTVEDAERNSDDDRDSDCDVGIEEAVAQQADPVQILRASVVSANGYVYKGGKNVILGKVLHHRPSPRLSQIEIGGFSSTVGDVTSGTRSEVGNTSALSPTPSSTPSTISDAASLTKYDSMEGRATGQRSSQSQLGPTAANSCLMVPPGEPPEVTTRLPKPHPLGKSSAPQRSFPSLPTKTSPVLKPTRTEAPPLRRSASISPPLSALQRPWKTPQTNGPGGSTKPPPAVVARDFADPTTSCRAGSVETAGQLQSEIHSGFGNPISEDIRENSVPRGYVHVKREESESQSSELDRSIATKKEAAAKALLKLQEVMVRPTWEEPSTTTRPRTHTKVPSHWRGLSIEDGSPIAPSAIFQRVKIPVLVPALSRHSTLSGRGERDLGHNPETFVNETAEGPLAPSPRAILNRAALSQAREDDTVASAASSDSPEPPWFKRRGRSDTAASQARDAHSRVGSTVSANSRTSMYSLPYHMVPARGSSMRDSASSVGDAGESPKFHVGELGWH
jgi:hypothetical protein